jgi:CDP-diacylglycerol--glycerol-3-phosphate 3-phosphatidyltransferase
MPNLLTFSRIIIALIIPLLLLLVNNLSIGILYLISFILFVFAAISDFFDGWLARKNDEETEIGRILDPIADKLLVILTLIPLMSNFDGLLVLSSILIIFREIFISGLRENLKSEKIILKVTLLSKWKTAIQLIAISNCLIHISLKHLETNQPILNFIFEISWFLSYLIIPAALLSLLTGFKYLKKASSFYIKENS